MEAQRTALSRQNTNFIEKMTRKRHQVLVCVISSSVTAFLLLSIFSHGNPSGISRLFSAVDFQGSYMNQTKRLPDWTCKVHDQLSWCVYSNSLCLDQNGGLILLTTDPSKDGRPVELQNELSPSPWHFPDVDELAQTSFGKYDVPFRSFFEVAHYALSSAKLSTTTAPGWSLVASFDAANYNIYHYMNKLHASFIARIYELGGLTERRLDSREIAVDILQLLRHPKSEFNNAYLFRPPPTPWQKGFSEVCLGNDTNIFYAPQIQQFQSRDELLCFENAVIPGAALYLSDGLASSVLFREHAARKFAIRVPESERNLITIFDRSAGNRRIVNLAELKVVAQEMAPSLQVVVVNWDGSVDFRTQALHMACTRIMIATHGSILNHNAFMEVAGVAIELNGYQFTYTLDDHIVLNRGNHYMRYAEDLNNTRHQGYEFGQDPFEGFSTRSCMADSNCLLARRDADIRIDIARFRIYFQRALSLVT